jgi:hypothetical protein
MDLLVLRPWLWLESFIVVLRVLLQSVSCEEPPWRNPHLGRISERIPAVRRRSSPKLEALPGELNLGHQDLPLLPLWRTSGTLGMVKGPRLSPDELVRAGAFGGRCEG